MTGKTMMQALIVDDEVQIRRFLRSSLSAHGYTVIEAASGQEALVTTRHDKLDVVILDLGLPDMDGLAVIRAIREHSAVPIVVLSVRSDERGKVEALDLGADDYVTKPFGMEELMARIRAALRHRLQEKGAEPLYRSGELTVDLVRRHVILKGVEVRLSPKEYAILRLLVEHAGKVLTHRYILQQVWGPAYVEEVQYLRVYVRQLRQKLEADPARPRYILVEPGVGYRLSPAE
jgi:two-component system KDP operon response regulator KdpE